MPAAASFALPAVASDKLAIALLLVATQLQLCRPLSFVLPPLRLLASIKQSQGRGWLCWVLEVAVLVTTTSVVCVIQNSFLPQRVQPTLPSGSGGFCESGCCCGCCARLACSPRLMGRKLPSRALARLALSCSAHRSCRPDGVQNDLPNLSISVGGGKESNYDCLSNGERNGKLGVCPISAC